MEVVLCGFSKGGVVLNQLLAEMAELGAHNSPLGDIGQQSDRGWLYSDRTGSSDSVGAQLQPRDSDSAQDGADLLGLVPQSSETLPQATDGVPSALQSPQAFLWSTSEVHFIDVGLNCRGAYVTDPSLVSNLMRFASGRVRGLEGAGEGGGVGAGMAGGRGGGRYSKGASEGSGDSKGGIEGESGCERGNERGREAKGASEGGKGGGRSAEPAAGRKGGAPGSRKGVLRVCLHGTPRQWDDRRRRWVGQEKESLVTLLVARGATLRRWTYNPGRKALVLRCEAQGQMNGMGMQLEAQGQRRTREESQEAVQLRGGREGQGHREGTEGESAKGGSAMEGGSAGAGGPGLGPRPLVAQNPATVFIFTRPRDSPPRLVGVRPERAQVASGSREGSCEVGLEVDVMSYFEGDKASMEMHFQVLEAMVLNDMVA